MREQGQYTKNRVKDKGNKKVTKKKVTKKKVTKKKVAIYYRKVFMHIY